MNLYHKTGNNSSLLNTITKIQSMFITNTDAQKLFEELLSNLIFHTESDYGFIGEVFYRNNGDPYLKSRAVSNIAWNDETRELYEKCALKGMEFTNLKSLFGTVLTTGKKVISNDPSNDLRHCGLPDGHPALNAFLGIPLYNGSSMVGMIGMANRPGGYNEEVVNHIQPLLATCAHIIEGYRIDQQRIKAEEALRKSEESLANAQKIAKIGNWDWDIVNNGLWWSDEIYRIFGVAPLEFEANYDAFISYVHPDDRKAVMDAVSEALQKKRPYNINHRIILSDGEIRTVHEQAEIEFSEGRPLRMSGTVQDITEQVNIQEALRNTEKQYRQLFEESKDVVFITTPEGIINDINQAGYALLGYSSMEELKSLNAIEFYSNPSEREDIKASLAMHGYVKDFEVNARRKDGAILTLSVTATAEMDKNQKITTIRGIARDMTEHKRLEQQLLHVQKMDAIGRLTGGIAHDFNNILTGITGYANLLNMKDSLDATAKGYSTNIITLAERAAKLTQGLLTFSRKQTMSLRPVNLNHVITEIHNLLIKIIRQDIEIVMNLTGQELIIMADSGQIEQIIMNLVTNANDAMLNGGKLMISTEQVWKDNDDTSIISNGNDSHGYYVKLNVSDNGVGMDEETKKRIFEPFFTTKEVGKGTGLGLSIIYGIVTSHKGSIHVDSEPGKGTSFIIYFPLARINHHSLPA